MILQDGNSFAVMKYLQLFQFYLVFSVRLFFNLKTFESVFLAKYLFSSVTGSKNLMLETGLGQKHLKNHQQSSNVTYGLNFVN